MYEFNSRIVNSVLNAYLKLNKVPYLNGNSLVDIGVGGTLDVESCPAETVHGLVVHEEDNVHVLHRCVREEYRVIGLHYCCRHLQHTF